MQASDELQPGPRKVAKSRSPRKPTAVKHTHSSGRARSAPRRHPPVTSERRADHKELGTSDKADGTLLLDPARIKASPYADRDPLSFQTPDFLTLRNHIADTGGNQVPIKVRPLPRGKGHRPSNTSDYEVVYGHRRHKACAELGLPVRALVADLSDEQLVIEMHSENMARRDLSAIERGRFYRSLLDRGVFPTQRALAARLGVATADVSRTLFIASLPPEVLDVISSPLDIPIHAADKLRPALETRPEEVLRRAAEVAETRGSLPAKLAIPFLIAKQTPRSGEDPAPPRVLDVLASGKRVARISVTATRTADVAIEVPLDEYRLAALERALLRVLK